jgi:hypothetical protein
VRRYAVSLVLLTAAAAIATAAGPPRIQRVLPEVNRGVAPGVLQPFAASGGVRYPLMLDDYCVYALSVRGTGLIDVSIEWDRDDVALAMRLFAPGTQQVIAEADGYRKVEISARADLRIVDPDGPEGDWMLEVRRVTTAKALGVRNGVEVFPDLRPVAAVQKAVRPAGIQPVVDRPGPGLLPAPSQIGPSLAAAGIGGLWEPEVRGTLTASWPGSGPGRIMNVTARREELRRRMEAMRTESDSLRKWQLQWDEGAKAYFRAAMSREDLEGVRATVNGAIDQLEQVGQHDADLKDEAREAAEAAMEQYEELLRVLNAIIENEREAASAITN